nr:uncharacterized protein LOC132425798 [Delphinus delphis]
MGANAPTLRAPRLKNNSGSAASSALRHCPGRRAGLGPAALGPARSRREQRAGHWGGGAGAAVPAPGALHLAASGGPALSCLRGPRFCQHSHTASKVDFFQRHLKRRSSCLLPQPRAARRATPLPEVLLLGGIRTPGRQGSSMAADMRWQTRRPPYSGVWEERAPGSPARFVPVMIGELAHCDKRSPERGQPSPARTLWPMTMNGERLRHLENENSLKD